MFDQRHFYDLWSRVGGRDDPSQLFARLLANYSQPARAYHNASHVDDCLRQLDFARGESQRPDEIELAIWFHDAIYDPRAHDNEQRSASWAAEALHEAQVQPDVVDRVATMILATKHDRETDNRDGCLLVDVDLSILGREPAVFDQYDRNIREEYRWVADDAYRAGRTAVLESFLRRPVIYRTAFFQSRFEAQARHNLQAAISRLQASG